MPDVRYHGTRDDLRRLVRGVVAAAAGRAPDPLGVAAPALRAGGAAVLAAVHAAFLVKSAGGPGPDGVTWAPLAATTVAYTRRGDARRKGGGKGMLSAAEERKWKAVYARTLAQFRARRVPDAEAAAARVAWAVLKREGARTLIGELGGKKVPIGQHTKALVRSLAPGGRKQILDAAPGTLAVGSAVPHAGPFHARRPLWPRAGGLGPHLNDALAAGVGRGLLAELARVIAGAGA